MKRFRVEYSSNNSGGGWWLDNKDWKELEKAGWKVAWAVSDKYKPKWLDTNGTYMGALATEAFLIVEADYSGTAEEIAISEWERITGQNAEAEGCDTCGRPHYFSTYDIEEEQNESNKKRSRKSS